MPQSAKRCRMSEPFDIYSDSFTVTLSPWGANLNLFVSDPQPAALENCQALSLGHRPHEQPVPQSHGLHAGPTPFPTRSRQQHQLRPTRQRPASTGHPPRRLGPILGKSRRMNDYRKDSPPRHTHFQVYRRRPGAAPAQSSVGMYLIPAGYTWDNKWRLTQAMTVEVRITSEAVLLFSHTLGEFGAREHTPRGNP